MQDEKIIRLVVEKALELCDFTDNYQLADLVGVARSSLSGAIKRGKLTRRYYDAIEAKCGASKADLFAIVEKENPYYFQQSQATNTNQGTGKYSTNTNIKGESVSYGDGGVSDLSEKEKQLLRFSRKYGEVLLDRLLEDAKEYEEAIKIAMSKK